HDPTRQRSVAFGLSANSQLATWEWDGVTWSKIGTATQPPSRQRHAMAWDAARQRVVLYGGMLGTAGPVASDLWEWDGASWTQRARAWGPRGRGGRSMAYDEARRRLVVFGGSAFGATAPLQDTWEWDGNAWSMASSSGPGRRWDAAMSYDPLRRRTWLHG